MGWEPTEVHEHYDADGALTGRTVVTREPEWDDEQRATVFERREYERQTCPHGHHAAEGMAADHIRWVEHERVRCLDCAAIETERENLHKREGHPATGPCDCRFEQFYIERREPLSGA